MYRMIDSVAVGAMAVSFSALLFSMLKLVTSVALRDRFNARFYFDIYVFTIYTDVDTISIII